MRKLGSDWVGTGEFVETGEIGRFEDGARCFELRSRRARFALVRRARALLDNIIVPPHCYRLVPHQVKAELLRFTSH